ncbi:MAG: hypothetical protein WC810_02960 [Janthinobacterium sp.]|jgi:hypothetical protein
MIPLLTQGQLNGATNAQLEEILNVLIGQINEHTYVMGIPLNTVKALIDKIPVLEEQIKNKDEQITFLNGKVADLNKLK